MGEIAKDLYERSSSAYCMYIQKMQSDECLGWEYKVRSGKFTKANLEAHTKAGELLGRHRALHEAADLVKSAAPETAAERDRLRDALRRLLATVNPGNADTHEAGCDCVIHEARAALDSSKPFQADAERDQLRAENERLREALEFVLEIDGVYQRQGGICEFEGSSMIYLETLEDIAEKARAALSEHAPPRQDVSGELAEALHRMVAAFGDKKRPPKMIEAMSALNAARAALAKAEATQ